MSSLKLMHETPMTRPTARAPSYVHQREKQQARGFTSELNGCNWWLTRSFPGSQNLVRHVGPPPHQIEHVSRWTRLHAALIRTGFWVDSVAAALDDAAPPPGIQEQLEGLKSLDENWDGAGAHPIAPEVIEAIQSDATMFVIVGHLVSAQLKDPWIAASADGGVGVDWRHDSRRLAMTYVRAQPVEFFAMGEGEHFGLVRTPAEKLVLATWLLKGGTSVSELADE